MCVFCFRIVSSIKRKWKREKKTPYKNIAFYPKNRDWNCFKSSSKNNLLDFFIKINFISWHLSSTAHQTVSLTHPPLLLETYFNSIPIDSFLSRHGFQVMLKIQKLKNRDTGISWQVSPDFVHLSIYLYSLYFFQKKIIFGLTHYIHNRLFTLHCKIDN